MIVPGQVLLVRKGRGALVEIRARRRDAQRNCWLGEQVSPPELRGALRLFRECEVAAVRTGDGYRVPLPMEGQ